jgi:hypothetical protein
MIELMPNGKPISDHIKSHEIRVNQHKQDLQSLDPLVFSRI